MGKQFWYCKNTKQTLDECEDKAAAQLSAYVVKMKDFNPASSLQVENNSKIVSVGIQPPSIHRQDFPTTDEELVAWARQKFGGVTSFTKVRNLISASTSGADGEDHRNSLRRIQSLNPKNNDILVQEHLKAVERIAVSPYYTPHAWNTEL